MGRTIALLLPFIIAGLLALYWVVYKAGKRKGQADAPQRANRVGSNLLIDVDLLLQGIVMRSDNSLTDMLSQESRKEINEWRAAYKRAINK